MHRYCSSKGVSLSSISGINLKLLRSIEDATLRISAAILQEDGTFMLRRISVGEYDLDQIDFFRAIFDTVPLEELVPKFFLIDDKIKVLAESKAITGKKFLKISKVVDDIEPILLYEYDKSKIKTAPLKFIDNKDRIIKLIGQLIETEYFDTEKLAIEIYNKYVCKNANVFKGKCRGIFKVRKYGEKPQSLKI